MNVSLVGGLKQKMLGKLFVLLFVLMAVSLVAGCGSSGEPATVSMKVSPLPMAAIFTAVRKTYRFCT